MSVDRDCPSCAGVGLQTRQPLRGVLFASDGHPGLVPPLRAFDAAWRRIPRRGGSFRHLRQVEDQGQMRVGLPHPGPDKRSSRRCGHRAQPCGDHRSHAIVIEGKPPMKFIALEDVTFPELINFNTVRHRGEVLLVDEPLDVPVGDPFRPVGSLEPGSAPVVQHRGPGHRQPPHVLAAPPSRRGWHPGKAPRAWCRPSP